MDGGITESISQPGIKEDIYAARTPIRRQGVGGITNQNYDQPGLKEDHTTMKVGITRYDRHGHNEDHNNKGGSNRRKIDLPGYKDDHKHYKKLKQSHGGFNQKMNQEDLKI